MPQIVEEAGSLRVNKLAAEVEGGGNTGNGITLSFKTHSVWWNGFCAWLCFYRELKYSEVKWHIIVVFKWFFALLFKQESLVSKEQKVTPVSLKQNGWTTTPSFHDLVFQRRVARAAVPVQAATRTSTKMKKSPLLFSCRWVLFVPLTSDFAVSRQSSVSWGVAGVMLEKRGKKQVLRVLSRAVFWWQMGKFLSKLIFWNLGEFLSKLIFWNLGKFLSKLIFWNLGEFLSKLIFWNLGKFLSKLIFWNLGKFLSKLIFWNLGEFLSKLIFWNLGEFLSKLIFWNLGEFLSKLIFWNLGEFLSKLIFWNLGEFLSKLIFWNLGEFLSKLIFWNLGEFLSKLIFWNLGEFLSKLIFWNLGEFLSKLIFWNLGEFLSKLIFGNLGEFLSKLIFGNLMSTAVYLSVSPPLPPTSYTPVCQFPPPPLPTHLNSLAVSVIIHFLSLCTFHCCASPPPPPPHVFCHVHGFRCRSIS